MGNAMRPAIVLAALLCASAVSAQTSVDQTSLPELQRSTIDAQIVSQLQRQLLDPGSISDLRTCAPFNVKMKDGRPSKWLVYFTINAKNIYGGYTGRSYYAALFRAGKPVTVSEVIKANAEGLDHMIVKAVEKDMVDCQQVSNDQIRRLLKE